MTKEHTIYHIGRTTGKGLVHAFTVEALDNGGIRLSKVSGAVTEEDRKSILATFGSAHRTQTGYYADGVLGTREATLKPGDPGYFKAAVYSLPSKFHPMRAE